MMIPLMLALSLCAAPQRRSSGPPPPPPPDIVAITQHAARLAVLEHRKQELEAALIEVRRQYGESHPQVRSIRAQLAQAEKALVGEGAEWRESEIAKLAERRAGLEGELAQARSDMGPNHPIVQSLRSEIEDLTARLGERSKALLESGVEQMLLSETTAKDTTNLDAFLRLARLYAAAGRTADAERVLTGAIALLRARGK